MFLLDTLQLLTALDILFGSQNIFSTAREMKEHSVVMLLFVY